MIIFIIRHFSIWLYFDLDYSQFCYQIFQLIIGAMGSEVEADELLILLSRSKMVPILHALYSEENPIRFTELKNRVDTSSTTLTRRLGELEDHRLVKRTVYETVPATVVYQLTDSGADLLPSLESFFEWVINDTNQTQ